MSRRTTPAFLVAPDSFKGTFSAAEVAEAIGSGIDASGGRAMRCPVADGGEGTLMILANALDGTLHEIDAHDPLGRPLRAPIGLVGGGRTAIVEVATASGLDRCTAAERDAEAASTYGTGELIVAASATAQHVVVTVGGSATTDGGRGALEAIAAAGGLGATKLSVLCDVTTPFERAAIVFGPQKGADADAVERLTARLNRQAAAMPRDPRGRPMTGGAGGLAGALWATHDAALLPGAAWILDALRFDERLIEVDAVVTGEGCLDHQTFEGKLIGEIAARCRVAGRPLHAVVGTSRLSAPEAQALGLASVTEATDAAAMHRAGRQLAAAGTTAR